MDIEKLKIACLKEEEIAHIKGWDFSHISDRYKEEDDIPWDYKAIIESYLKDDMKLLDYDTGGGEFLLSLSHPYKNTSATEGFPPNVSLCKERLLPLGIDFRECSDCSHLPFEDESFDIYINRHGDLDPKEAFRVLKRGGLFITQQVGSENDHDLVLKVLPDAKVPFPDMKLDIQGKRFAENGFEIIEAAEHFGSIRFFDTSAFVWFARIIEWEFDGFSVERCFQELIKIEEEIKSKGYIEGTTHRYLIVARKIAG